MFTPKYVAEKLGEDEEWLWDLQINMEPEEGCLWVHGAAYGIEYLEQIIADERAAGRAPPKLKSKMAPCGAHRMLTVIRRTGRINVST